MSNPFYNPTGNPATGSDGLSALIRGEFVLIGTAFDMMPAITTTGTYSTVINQSGSFTYTLPAYGGTFALSSDVATAVATETTRAEAAEATNATAIGAETTRAEAAEATNATAIGAETTRAETAESGLTTLISAEVAAEASARNTAIAAAVAAETTRAEAAEATNATAISTETTRAEAAETAITSAYTAAIAAAVVAAAAFQYPALIGTEITGVITLTSASAGHFFNVAVLSGYATVTLDTSFQPGHTLGFLMEATSPCELIADTGFFYGSNITSEPTTLTMAQETMYVWQFDGINWRLLQKS